MFVKVNGHFNAPLGANKDCLINTDLIKAVDIERKMIYFGHGDVFYIGGGLDKLLEVLKNEK